MGIRTNYKKTNSKIFWRQTLLVAHKYHTHASKPPTCTPNQFNIYSWVERYCRLRAKWGKAVNHDLTHLKCCQAPDSMASNRCMGKLFCHIVCVYFWMVVNNNIMHACMHAFLLALLFLIKPMKRTVTCTLWHNSPDRLNIQLTMAPCVSQSCGFQSRWFFHQTKLNMVLNEYKRDAMNLPTTTIIGSNESLLHISNAQHLQHGMWLLRFN